MCKATSLFGSCHVSDHAEILVHSTTKHVPGTLCTCYLPSIHSQVRFLALRLATEAVVLVLDAVSCALGLCPGTITSPLLAWHEPKPTLQFIVDDSSYMFRAPPFVHEHFAIGGSSLRSGIRSDSPPASRSISGSRCTTAKGPHLDELFTSLSAVFFLVGLLHCNVAVDSWYLSRYD